MHQSRLPKLRFRRHIKQSQDQAKNIGNKAEKSLDRYLFKRLDKFKTIRRFVLGWVGLFVALTAGVLLQTSNLSHYYQNLRSVPGGTYREGVLGTFNTANPLYATSDVDTTVSKLLFASLFKHDQRNKLVGELASSYDVNNVGTVYTVHLKPHLHWHDGVNLTSADVLFTYKAIQNPDAQSPLRGSWQGITVTAPNPATVVFTLPGPLASFPNNMTNGIVPKHKLQTVAAAELRTADFNTISPVGSGPFKWQAIQVTGSDPSNAEEQLAMTPFNGYVGGQPKVERFVVHAYADKSHLIGDFIGGALTGLSGVSSKPKELAKVGSVEVHNFSLTAGVFEFFKTTNPILSDQKVRHALVLAADPHDIIQRLPYPTKPVKGPLLAGQLANDLAITQPKHDLAAAKKELDDAGWTVGNDGVRAKDKQRLAFNVVATDTDEYKLVTGELQKQWKDLGVDLSVRLQSIQNFQNTLAFHDYDSVLYGISIGNDPDVFVYWDSSQADVRSTNRLNLSEYKNSAADASLESGRTRLDPTLRTLKYRPFLQAWQQDSPALGLYQPRVLYLTNGNVANLEDHTVNTATDRFNNVQNWMIRQAKVNNN